MRTFIVVAHSDNGDIVVNNNGKKTFTTLLAAQQVANQTRKYLTNNVEIYRKVDLD